MGIIMNYPTIDSFSAAGISDISAENMLDVIVAGIDSIYDKGGEEVYDAKDSTKKELVEFIEQLNTQQFQDVQKFFDSSPKIVIEHDYTCSVCEKNSHLELEGLGSFFE